MKTLKYLGFFLTAMFFFIACSKELSLETGFSGGGAVGYLGSVAGQCDTNIVRGQYVRDSVMKDSNYVLVDVTFQSPGLYKIVTETENGFSFYDSGYMINTGLQTIKLKAVGRPIAKGNTSFLVTFDTSFCSFTVAVLDTPSKSAQFTIADSAGKCAFNFQGIYKQGVALNPNTNIFTMNMNVTFPGAYNLTTQTINGITFKSSGTFNNVGPNQVIIFRGTGTPIRGERDSVRVTAGSTSCTIFFTVDSIPTVPGPTAADSAWQFNQGSPFYHGSIDSAKIDSLPFVTSSGVIKVPGVGVWGKSYATGDSSFFIGVPLTADTVRPGTYMTNSLSTPAAFLFHKTPSTASVIYTASFLDVGVNTTVTVISYDKVNKIITGTFTGTARNATLTSVPITNGKFTAKVR